MLKIEDLKVGSVIVLGPLEREVHAVAGKLVFASEKNKFDIPGEVFTIQQLNDLGYKLKPDHPEFEVDQPLIARNGEVWSHRRHFAFFKEGKIYCWKDGRTSWTSRGAVSKWEHYRLPTQEELNS